MRKSDREITDLAEIIDVLHRSDTIRLGLHSRPYPYVVPLSFGFETVDDKIIIYFHGATEGFKHDLIQENPFVCVETDIFHRYAETANGITTEYESFIGFGEAERITGTNAVKGLDLLLAHCGYDGFVYDHAVLDIIWIYRIKLDSFTGKRRFTERV